MTPIVNPHLESDPSHSVPVGKVSGPKEPAFWNLNLTGVGEGEAEGDEEGT
jgi:hypothetical protein